MQIKRINDNTLSCILSPEDLRANGFQIDDFFERKKEAVDFIRSTVIQAAISENFDLTGDMTMMRVSILPDHSLSLLITKETTPEGAAREVRRLAQSIFEAIAERAAEKADRDGQDREGSDFSADDLMKAILSDAGGRAGGPDSEKGEENASAAQTGADTYMFSFFTMREAMNCGKVFAQAGPLASSLYYLAEDDTYFLIVRRTPDTPAGFEKLVLSANEFGELITSKEQYISYVTEHGVCIAREHAVEMFMDVMPGLKVPGIRRNGET